MNNLVGFSATCTTETALRKLNKASVEAYKLQKRGAQVYFAVKSEYVQKVFAIFSHPCYNITIRRKSAKIRLADFIKRRLGLVLGAVLFVAACFISNSLVLKIEVKGSGDYLKEQIVCLAQECGAKYWATDKNLDKPLLTARILSMPQVTFCSVQKKGSILEIVVHTEQDAPLKDNKKPLKSPFAGEVIKIVAISGTAEKSAGDKVAAGDTLIGAYIAQDGGETYPVIAAGWAEIKRKCTLSLFFDSESEENKRAALASCLLYTEEPSVQTCKAAKCEGGVTYTVEFSYISVISINME